MELCSHDHICPVFDMIGENATREGVLQGFLYNIQHPPGFWVQAAVYAIMLVRPFSPEAALSLSYLTS